MAIENKGKIIVFGGSSTVVNDAYLNQVWLLDVKS